MPAIAAVGKPERSGTMSEATVAIVAVIELLPPAVVPPLLSLRAPVTAVSVVEPGAVGVPLTAQLMLAPAAIVAGVVGEQVPMVTPGGRPEIAHVAAVALAVALALLVHLRVPV